MHRKSWHQKAQPEERMLTRIDFMDLGTLEIAPERYQCGGRSYNKLEAVPDFGDFDFIYHFLSFYLFLCQIFETW